MSMQQSKHIRDLQERADAGDLDACAKIGHIYATGNHPLGIHQDHKIAAQYYEKGAQAGDLPCMFGLAGTYLSDNPEKAIAQLEVCAQRKHLWSLAVLGDFYLRGCHVPQDPHKAFLYLQEYTSLCRPDKIGQNAFKVRWDLVLYPLCLLLGVGCEKDEKKALAILSELAGLGNLSARDILHSGKLNDWMAAKRFNFDIKTHGPLTLFDGSGQNKTQGVTFTNKPRLHKPQYEITSREHLSQLLQRSLMPDETIIMRGHFPLIYTIDTFLRPILFLFMGHWLVQLMASKVDAVYARLPYQVCDWLYQYPQLPLYVLGGYGVFVFLCRMLNKWTTEIVLTDQRFIYKRGLFSVEMIQMNFWQIDHSDVTQSILGTLLDYGHVHIQSYAVQSRENSTSSRGTLTLPLISHPFLFTRLIEDNRQLPYKGRMNNGQPTPVLMRH